MPNIHTNSYGSFDQPEINKPLIQKADSKKVEALSGKCIDSLKKCHELLTATRKMENSASAGIRFSNLTDTKNQIQNNLTLLAKHEPDDTELAVVESDLNRIDAKLKSFDVSIFDRLRGVRMTDHGLGITW
jgi:hypothetical protein